MERRKTNIMNWRTLLLLAILPSLPTGLAAQKKKKEKEKAEQPKTEMTYQKQKESLEPPPIRERIRESDCLQQEDTRESTMDQV